MTQRPPREGGDGSRPSGRTMKHVPRSDGSLDLYLTLAEACLLGAALTHARPSGTAKYRTPAGEVRVHVDGLVKRTPVRR